MPFGVSVIRNRSPLLLVTVLLLCFLGISTSSGADYNYTELVPSGWAWAQATGINASGVVVGYGHDDSSAEIWKGFLYSGGTYTPLLSSGWAFAGATGINSSGAVVGYGNTGSTDKGFLYSGGTGGTYTELLPPGWSSVLGVTGINANGAIVGYGYTGTTDRGFLYTGGTGGTYTELLPPGWTGARANGINSSGVVVGGGTKDSVDKGFLYSGGTGGTYTELLPPGWTAAEATGVNDSGVIVGHRGLPVFTDKAFLYSGGTNGTYTELLPPGWASAEATGINASGVVVGGGFKGFTQMGFLYSGGTNGTYTELLPPGWASAQAFGINDNGIIVGYGDDGTGNYKGFIAVPSIHLAAGWNFISFPVTPTPSPSPIGTVLADVLSHVVIAWGYDNMNKEWLKYRPNSEGSTLTSIETGKGYWIYTNAPCAIATTGWTTAFSNTVHLFQGWNLVGYLGGDGAPLSTDLGSIAGKWTLVWGWDKGQWAAKHVTIPVLPSPIQPLSLFNYGKAYWILAGQATDWTQ
jgi:hypothetical protein